MLGMDISAYQEGIDLSVGDYDFCIIKATEGTTSISKTFYDYAVQLTRLDKLIGCYHFARPDISPTIRTMENEAQHFLDVVTSAGLLNKAILVLDWEKEPFNNEELISAWVNYVKERTNSAVFIYGSKSKLMKWRSWKVFKDNLIWLAQYPTIKTFPIGQHPTAIYNNIKVPEEIPWAIWQYTSNGKYPGYNGNVDLDLAQITKEEWKRLAGDSEEAKSEVLTDDMKWAISIGLFAGYPDGKYKPTEPLTREQAASLFRRYTDYLKSKKQLISTEFGEIF